MARIVKLKLIQEAKPSVINAIADVIWRSWRKDSKKDDIEYFLNDAYENGEFESRKLGMYWLQGLPKWGEVSLKTLEYSKGVATKLCNDIEEIDPSFFDKTKARTFGKLVYDLIGKTEWYKEEQLIKSGLSEELVGKLAKVLDQLDRKYFDNTYSCYLDNA